MTTEQISDDAKAILLLCGHFGGKDDVGAAPLDIRDYNELSEWLVGRKWRPADLLSTEGAAALEDAFFPLEPARVKKLLARGAAMAFALEKWLNKGLWVLCRSDNEYPQRVRMHLKRNAPPVLFGAGNRALLEQGGLAVVGSRNVDPLGEHFAASVSERCAQQGFAIVSGGARGVDSIAMNSALESAGKVIGVLADSLLRTSVSGACRDAFRDDRLVLLSPYNPEAGFNVGNAMGRNKLIYALADFAVVVSSDFKSGGTWAGAEEELKRDGGRMVFVRSGEDVPRGNSELLKLGAKAFPEEAMFGDVREALKSQGNANRDEEPVSAPAYAEISESKPAMIRESPAIPSIAPLPASIYDAVRPLLLNALTSPKTAAELAKELNVKRPQVDEWMKTAIRTGEVTAMKKPLRYVRNTAQYLSI